MSSHELEGIEWIKSLYLEGLDKKEERQTCPFKPEMFASGSTKKCYLKASPQVCHLCLMGKFIEILEDSLDSIAAVIT